MRIVVFAMGFCLVLAACGADGPPERPGQTATPGITVSGEARIGVTGRLR